MHMLSLYSLGLSSFVQRSIDEGYNGKYILPFFLFKSSFGQYQHTLSVWSSRMQTKIKRSDEL